MSSDDEQIPGSGDQSKGQGAGSDEEMVDKVAELVYKMWKRDLRIEKERYRTRARRFNRTGGL